MTNRYTVSTDPLSDAEVKSLAPVVSHRLARSLLGRPRVLHELATGATPTGETACTPQNPQGLIGADLSGPPWGVAVRHSLVTREAHQGGAGVYAPTQSVSLTVQDQAIFLTSYWICRPFAVSDTAPYSKAYLRLTWARIGGAGTASIDVTALDDDDSDTGMLQTLTSASATPATSTTIVWLPTQPGRNSSKVKIKLNGSVGATIYGWHLYCSGGRSV